MFRDLWDTFISMSNVIDEIENNTSDGIRYIHKDEGITVIEGTLSKYELAALLNVDIEEIKAFPYKGHSIFVIESEPSKEVIPLSKDMLNIFYFIGKKYLDGESIHPKYEKEILVPLGSDIKAALNMELEDPINVIVKVENHDVCIAFDRYISKDFVCDILGIDADLFIEVSSPFATALLCCCPRVALEHLYDMQNDGEGFEKWMI